MCLDDHLVDAGYTISLCPVFHDIKSLLGIADRRDGR